MLCFVNKSIVNAEVAHLVEHDLAKVGVAGSSPVFRSKSSDHSGGGFFALTTIASNYTKVSLDKLAKVVITCPGGGIGRHAGLKIL